MAAAGTVLPRTYRDNALTWRRLGPVIVALAAAGLTWWTDVSLLHRVSNGTDHAVRLAAVLTYVGVDGSYTLARACGIAALVFAYAAVLLGLWPARPGSGRDRSGAASLVGALHRQVGAVTLVLIAGHLVLPYSSAVAPYGGWRTGLLPWGQPVSWGVKAASWQSIGILAFYLLILTGPTYWLFRSRPVAWRIGHRLTIVAYGLAVAHAFLLGTDFLVSGPARLALLAAQVPVLLLLCLRLAPATSSRNPLRWSLSLLAAAASAGMTVLTVLSATGEYAHGMRL